MSIRINDQWRICFQWSKGDADDVEIVDYHSALPTVGSMIAAIA
jgi:RelE-like toxin of type II toxin-antitoxin system HigB